MAENLIQLLLPLADNSGELFPDSVLEDVKNTIVAKFGGVTAFEMAPAQGVWAAEGSGKHHDQIVIIEVMVEAVDSAWWAEFRGRLEKDFRQKEIVVRAFPIRQL